MKLEAYDLNSDKKSVVEVISKLFESEVNEKLIAQAVRVYQARLRQGNANTKTRGEVAGSTRKIYKQKGTGRARHGSMKAPVFVGGGTVFGPRAHGFDLELPVSMKRAALLSALSFKAENVKALQGLVGFKGKTKDISKALDSILNDSKKILCVLASADRKEFRMGVQNIKRVITIPASDLTAYDVLLYPHVVIEDEAVAVLESRLASKLNKENK